MPESLSLQSLGLCQLNVEVCISAISVVVWSVSMSGVFAIVPYLKPVEMFTGDVSHVVGKLFISLARIKTTS